MTLGPDSFRLFFVLLAGTAGVVLFVWSLALRRKTSALESQVTEKEESLRAAEQRLTEVVARLTNAREELQRVARVDPLTGLWNRRQVDEVFPRELDRSRRHGEPIILILFDLDHFKSVNDLYGHPVGDAALVEASRRALASVRTSDWLIRWGGEEFLVLAPNTSLVGGTELAERIRAALATEPVPGAGHVTASFGVAQLQQGESFDSCTARADRALSLAKSTGRNNVMADHGTGEGVLPSGPVVRLVWDGSLASGDPVIDAGHRRLIDLGNHALLALAADSDREKLLEIVARMEREVFRHFGEEEAELTRARWEGLAEHRKLHQALQEEMLMLAKALRDGSASPERYFSFVVHEVILHHVFVRDTTFSGMVGPAA